MMAKVVNLRSARKARDRDARKATANQNSARFGRSKAEKQLDAAEADKARRELDGHARD